MVSMMTTATKTTTAATAAAASVVATKRRRRRRRVTHSNRTAQPGLATTMAMVTMMMHLNWRVYLCVNQWDDSTIHSTLASGIIAQIVMAGVWYTRAFSSFICAHGLYSTSGTFHKNRLHKSPKNIDQRTNKPANQRARTNEQARQNVCQPRRYTREANRQMRKFRNPSKNRDKNQQQMCTLHHMLLMLLLQLLLFHCKSIDFSIYLVGWDWFCVMFSLSALPIQSVWNTTITLSYSSSACFFCICLLVFIFVFNVFFRLLHLVLFIWIDLICAQLPMRVCVRESNAAR